MKFSLFVHMERYDEQTSHRQLFEDLTELTLMAEAGGFSTVWIGEHHAMEYTISPSPMPLLAYLAARTSTIHLGAGTIIAPFWHPIRVAGECALLDVISNGRMEVGLARGAYQYEFDRMAGGMPASSGGHHLREMVPVVKALWQGDYAHEGDIWQFPATTSSPKPIQQPAQLASGKISVRHEPRHGFDVLFKSFLAEPGDNRRGSAALPDNRVVQRPAGFPIPEQRGLALVGDADCRDAVQRNAGNADDLAQRVNLRIKDRRRVVLHPAGLRINLLKFIALHGDDPRAFVEQNGAGAGCPLIERNHIGMHGAKPPVFSYKTRRRRSSPRRRRPSVSYFSSTKYSMPPVVPTTISLP